MSQTAPLTLTVLAAARGLSPSLLRRLGWTEQGDSVSIPWRRADGQTAWHIRHCLEKSNGQRRWSWQNFARDQVLPYLSQYLSTWRAKGHTVVVIVESETDAVCLASANLAAIATGGADNWQGRWWSLLTGFRQVVVWLEDGGSLPLLQAVLRTRPADGPTVCVCHALDRGAKDPGRLLAQSNGQGQQVLRAIVERAVPVEPVGDLLEAVTQRLRAEKQPGGTYSARCPFHDDRHPSLSLFKGDDGRWAFRCHAGACGVGGSLGLLAAAVGLVGEGADSAQNSILPIKDDSWVETNSAPNSIPPTYKGESWAETNFQTADALLAEPESETPWLLHGYLPQGGVVLLSARAKMGKTTWLFHLLRALLAGEAFLGRPTHLDGRVALLSEEPPSLVARRLRTLGLSGDRLLVAFRHRTQASLAALVQEALQHGARLIVIDTLGAWGNIADENAAAEVEAALRPLVSAVQQAGACLLILHHLRKSDGPEGTAHRGSGHLVAMADIALELRRPEGQGPETRRVLRALSRYEETPPELVLDLTPEGYVVLGTAAEAQQQQVRQTLLDLLPGPGEAPIPLEGAPGTDSVLARLRAGGLAAPRTTVQRVLEGLITEGLVERCGRGVRGDPARYRLAPQNSFLPNSYPKGKNENELGAGVPAAPAPPPAPPSNSFLPNYHSYRAETNLMPPDSLSAPTPSDPCRCDSTDPPVAAGEEWACPRCFGRRDPPAGEWVTEVIE